MDPKIDAQLAFNKKIKRSNVIDNGKSILQSDGLKSRKINWEKATSKTKGDSVIVFAPIEIPYDISIGMGGITASLNDKLFLRIMNTGTGFENAKIEMIVVVNPPKANQTTSSGFIIVEDWFNTKPRAKTYASKRNIMLMSTEQCVTWWQTRCAGHESDMHCETFYFQSCWENGSGPQDPSVDYDVVPESGTGGGGGGGDGNSSSSPQEIIDMLTDPCLSKILKDVTNSNMSGVVKDILKSLGENPNIEVTFQQVHLNGDPAHGNSAGTFTRYPNGFVTYSGTVTLNTSVLENSSREMYAGVMIHEAIHSYFRVTTGSDEALTGLDHDVMAKSYIAPMASFLSNLYGISLFDASAIAWKGLNGTKAYSDASNFLVGAGNNQTSYPKIEIEQQGTRHQIGQAGTNKCQ